MCCEPCVVRLTLLMGMGLPDTATPLKSLETGTGELTSSEYLSPTIPLALPTIREDGFCAGCGLVFLVQLCFQFQD